MLACVATLRVKANATSQFEAQFNAWAAQVRSMEPGLKLYLLTKLRDEQNTYQVLELYDSQAAQDLHMRNLQTAEAIKQLTALLDGPPTLKLADSIE